MLTTRTSAVVSLLITGGLVGCVMPPQQGDESGAQAAVRAPQGAPTPGEPGATGPRAGEGSTLATMRTFQYLRIDGEKTGIMNAADDGRYTYIAFNRKVPADVTFFDQEGQPISAASSGQVVALPRIFKTGVLVRIGSFNSYVTPNPRATSDDRPPLESDPEVIDARTRLELATSALPSFRQAIERADQTMRGMARQEGSTPSALPPSLRTTSATPVAAYQVPPLPTLRTPAPNEPTYQVLANGVLVRVFFASGGRAIVRPDDGLQRLEVEAQKAREIRISGYTDSIGSDEANTHLARQRADSIRELLVRRGIPEDKILVAWTGTGRYIADNQTALGRAMNRRVEVTFIRDESPRAASE